MHALIISYHVTVGVRWDMRCNKNVVVMVVWVLASSCGRYWTSYRASKLYLLNLSVIKGFIDMSDDWDNHVDEVGITYTSTYVCVYYKCRLTVCFCILYCMYIRKNGCGKVTSGFVDAPCVCAGMTTKIPRSTFLGCKRFSKTNHR